jgi:hypothetical protein
MLRLPNVDGSSRGSFDQGLAPENFTTLPHFSVSSAIGLVKSAGEPRNAAPPMSANRAVMAGSASTALISELRGPRTMAHFSSGRPPLRRDGHFSLLICRE